MPSRRSPHLTAKATFVLHSLSTEELKKGYRYEKTTMYKKFVDKKPFFKDYTVSVKGSALSKNKIDALKMGAKPTQRDLKELDKMYRRFQYHELRRVGASVKIAKQKAAAPITEARKAVLKFEKWVQQVQKTKAVRSKDETKKEALKYIRAAFSRSEKEFDDFEKDSISGLGKHHK